VNLTIKNIPEDVYKVLKQTAAHQGRSLNAEVNLLLREKANLEAQRKHIRDTWDEFEKFRRSLPKMRKGTAVKLIREDRESH